MTDLPSDMPLSGMKSEEWGIEGVGDYRLGMYPSHNGNILCSVRTCLAMTILYALVARGKLCYQSVRNNMS